MENEYQTLEVLHFLVENLGECTEEGKRNEDTWNHTRNTRSATGLRAEDVQGAFTVASNTIGIIREIADVEGCTYGQL